MKTRLTVLLSITIMIASIILGVTPATVLAQAETRSVDDAPMRVSVASDGTQGNSLSERAAISADGHMIAFRSNANNLVNGDTNGVADVFVRDQQTGQTTRVSVASDGTQANDMVRWLAISGNGRFVAFSSRASNLVSGDTNGHEDIFVHDRQTGQTTRVSVASNGAEGNGSAFRPTISADGRYVVFSSFAYNLVAGDSGGNEDIFLHDRQTGQTMLVSVDSNGTQANRAASSPTISADGRFVAFDSGATNLVAGDTNGQRDIFVRDLQMGETTLISIAHDNTQGNGASFLPTISADGNFVVFNTLATNLGYFRETGDTVFNITVHNRQSGLTYSIFTLSVGQAYTTPPTISADGRFIVFHSDGNGPSSFAEILLYDQDFQRTISFPNAPNGDSALPAISADGRVIAFQSSANNLVSGDTNAHSDIFSSNHNFGAGNNVPPLPIPTDECVIPESGPWPPCATGGNTPPPAGECMIPESGPWPPCATGGNTPPTDPPTECVIPPSGPWPACARSR